MIRFLVKLWRTLNDRCVYCGGQLHVYSDKKAWCDDCGMED
jgi:hypothetical protein